MTDKIIEQKSKQSKKLVIGIAILMVIFALLATLHNRTQERMAILVKLGTVQEAIDRIKFALDKAYQKGQQLPKMTIVITRANQGKAVTPDWAALGFKTLPQIPPEIDSLLVTPQGEIVVVMTRIGFGINGTEVHAQAERDEKQSKWVYTCTSTDSRVKRQFHC